MEPIAGHLISRLCALRKRRLCGSQGLPRSSHPAVALPRKQRWTARQP